MYEIIKSAFSQLLGNKLRTFLTMLGMLIGIGAVIMILALGEGMKGFMMEQMSSVGKGVIQIILQDFSEENLLDSKDIEMLKEIPEVREAMFIHSGYMTAVQDVHNENRELITAGIPYNYEEIQSIQLKYGRMFSERDEEVRNHVIIVDDNFSRMIFNKNDPSYALGKSIEIPLGGEKHSFEIVGVAKSQFPSTAPEEMVVNIGYIPFKTLAYYIMDGQNKSYMAVVDIDEKYNVNDYTKPIKKLLEKRHGTEDAYNVASIAEQTEALTEVIDIVNIFVSVVAGISLLVGGIGIMNIMLVTVRERKKEIGIRKAIGAPDKQIWIQFLMEAIILTVVGGVSGLLVGYIGSLLIGNLLTVVPQLTVGMIVFSVGISSMIGIIFGVYPAYKASKLDPIEALREE